jgi:uncharacterized membrane protein YidH (DUF202 family)
MNDIDAPLDKGMPQERTLLSWRRTAMTLAIAGFALARLAMEASVFLAGVLAVIAFSLIMTIVMGSLKRYRAHDPIHTGGKTAAMLSISTILLAIVEILIVLMK